MTILIKFKEQNLQNVTYKEVTETRLLIIKESNYYDLE